MRALISVSNKEGLEEFAQELTALGFEIISTGGTAQTLKENGIDVIGISEITNFPECLDGRVKTLHPAVHGGILAIRDNETHMQQLAEQNITPIDLVVINLYPFKNTILKPDVHFEEAIENIDIGGPAMLRSSAKNHKDVIVICDPSDYEEIIAEYKEHGTISYDTKYQLALKVFEHTAAYDAMIADYFRKQSQADLNFPQSLTLTYEKIQDLRYGENPHQEASYYREIQTHPGALVNAKQLHGKELSFNNINDTNAAIALVREFDEPTIVAVKHANPCGVGCGDTLLEAYQKAYDADPVSIYGGIIASNKPIDGQVASEISKIFVEIIIAPSYTPEAISLLVMKKNLRLLELPELMQAPTDCFDMKKVSGGILIQESDQLLYSDEEMRIVTTRKPTLQETEDLAFAMKIVKHIKSNGIVLAKNKKTIGIGPGQTNRIWAVENAIKQATESVESAVMASDAFFPFDDCVTAAAEAGVTAIIQPGGSIRDQESIDKAEELELAMVFTGMRHFKH